MAIKNYATGVSAERTVMEVQKLLAQKGAGSVEVIYANRLPAALLFTIETPVGPRTFRLPAQTAGVQKALARMDTRPESVKRKKGPLAYTRPEHVQAVAWRIVKDWVAAQLAIVEAGMASLDEIMLPYMLVGDSGHSLYQAYAQSAVALPEAR